MGGAGGEGGSGASGGGGAGGSGGEGMGFSSLGASSYETQTSLASDGLGGLVVVWVAIYEGGGSAVGYTLSRDGGDSWTTPAYLPAPDDRLSTNPVVAVDDQGRFTLVWLGFRLDFNDPDEHVYVAQIEPGGDSFGAPVNASDDGSSTATDYDKPSLAIDANGDVLVTWADFTGFNQGTPASLVFARSLDGSSFTKTTIVNDGSFGNLAQLCLDAGEGPTAPLYLVHLGAGGTLTLRKSIDQGASFQLTGAPSAASVVFQQPSCAVRGDSVSLVYGAGDAPFDPTHDSPADRVEIVTSNNGGTGFGQPSVVAPQGGTQYLFPRVAVGPNDELEVVYYEGLLGGDATFMHASSDNGTSWTRAPIGPAGTLAIDLTLASWLGGYVGVVVPGATGFVSFTENSQGKTHIAFAEIALP